LPFSEATIRLPTALVGIADVVLMFLLAQQLFKHDGLAFAAAAMLALTPAHFMHSRLAVNVLYPLPFTLTWLLLLLLFLERGRVRTLFAATLALGVGVYSYVAAVVMMPLYFVLTSLTLVRKRATIPQYLAAVAGFAMPLSLLVWWHIRHPARYAELVSSYHVYDAGRMNPLQGVKDLVSHFRPRRDPRVQDFFVPACCSFRRQQFDQLDTADGRSWPVASLPAGLTARHASEPGRTGCW
jgi:4-amino-4-deoxy-L-arabinose transferase-like glycosyltransferase